MDQLWRRRGFTSTERIGVVRVSISLINQYPIALRQLFSAILVLRAEYRPALRAIEYEAICSDFDEVPEGSIIPEYDVVISSSGIRFGKPGERHVLRY